MGQFVRWYDKDKHLSAFLALVQGLSEDLQSEIAMDIMINLPSVAGAYLNDYANNMARHAPNQYRRWYDYNPTCHSAVEMMRQLNTVQREIIISATADIILRSSYEDE